jgi:Ca-activated chloride channel homolog
MTLPDSIAFHWPQLLWLLLLPVGFAGWELSRRRRLADTTHPKILRAEAAPGFLTLVSGASAISSGPRLRWRLWLGLALVVGALARPQWGRVEEQVFDQAREVLVAVDLSRSMLAPDVPPSRLERAKLLITSLLERLEGERVGLVVFAGTAFLQSPLSADYEILREFLPALGPDFLPEGGTNYTALLQTALDAFGTSTSADRFLIVLSDGESQTNDWEKLVGELRERNVKALCLGIGTTEGAMLPDGQGGFVKDERGAVVLSRLNNSTLEDLARRTGGVYRDASSWVDLAQLLQETVEAGRQGDFTEVSRIRRVERFQWLLAPALLVLLISFWREFPVHPRPRAIALTPGGGAARSSPPANQTPATASHLAAALLIMSALAVHGTHLVGAPPNPSPFAAPLNEVIGRLAAKGQISAPEYAEMANATITYGQRMMTAQQPAEAGAIADGLEAVAAGEKLDPRAADWAKLRAELEALKPPEQPEQDQQQSDQDQKPADDQKKQQEQQQQQNQSGQKQDQQDQSQSEQSQDQQQSGEPGQQSDAQNDNQPGEEQQPEESESAFGDMKDPPPSPSDNQPPQPEPSENQKVGGQSDRRNEAEQNPALIVPLQKLEQLKQQDSPAKLYQLMQDPNARPTPKGRDW